MRRGMATTGIRLLLGAGLTAMASSGAMGAQDPAKSTPPQQTVPESEVRWNELTVQYSLLYGVKQYAKAIPVAQEALSEAEKQFGGRDLKTAQTLNDLGHLYLLQGDPTKAEPLHTRALAIREQALPAEDAAVVQSLVNLAKADHAQGHYAAASRSSRAR